uniref:Uncharacterized protein n=1 Tax=Amazona collaria TaxID=241587 RepID=A0A8B9IT39_9PSIT
MTHPPPPPPGPGDYNINILFAGAHVPGSPFRAAVRAPFDASKVTCSGPGLEGATAGQAGHFRVDCSRAGSAELTIGIASEAGARAEVRVEDNGDGTYTIAYTPLSPGVYTVTVEYGGQPVPAAPPTSPTASPWRPGESPAPRSAAPCTWLPHSARGCPIAPTACPWVPHSAHSLPVGAPQCPQPAHGCPIAPIACPWVPHSAHSLPVTAP